MLASTLLASPALAQTLPNSCPGMTFQDNFQNGLSNWVFGGQGNLAPTNSAYNYTAPTQNQTETVGPDGLNLSVLPMTGANGAPNTSGLMSTESTFSQTYGVFTATVDLPAAMEQPNMGWAFWLLGEGGVMPGSQQGWTGEIDSAEADGQMVSSSMHSGFTANSAAQYNYTFPSGDHTFVVDKEADMTTWYVDGQQVQQAPTPEDLKVPMFIILGSSADGPVSGPASVQFKQVSAFQDMQSYLNCQSSATASPTSPKLDPERCLLTPKGPGCPADVSSQAAYLQAQQQVGMTPMPTAPISSPTPSPPPPPPPTSITDNPPPPAPASSFVPPSDQSPTTPKLILGLAARSQSPVPATVPPPVAAAAPSTSQSSAALTVAELQQEISALQDELATLEQQLSAAKARSNDGDADDQ
ncbi:MAG TPA: family 16 glycosylhydrolase [Pseudolysinimonas sp.]